MKNYSTVLLGALGENLVVSELARRGVVSTTFSGNVPDIDILAFKNNVSIRTRTYKDPDKETGVLYQVK